jgi:hypothetical protein
MGAGMSMPIPSIERDRRRRTREQQVDDEHRWVEQQLIQRLVFAPGHRSGRATPVRARSSPTLSVDPTMPLAICPRWDIEAQCSPLRPPSEQVEIPVDPVSRNPRDLPVVGRSRNGGLDGPIKLEQAYGSVSVPVSRLPIGREALFDGN